MTPEQSERVLREPDVFLGQSLPRCALANGLVGATAVLAKELETLSAPVFVADIVAQHWIFADVPRLQGSAPWNYGSLSGIENAEYVVVPTCARSDEYRKTILEKIENTSGFRLSLTHDTPHFRAYSIAWDEDEGN